MEHLPLLGDLTIVLAVGTLVAVVLSRLHLPAAAGLLAAGALMGPSGLGLVRSVGSIEALAEVGVILLLFTIGLEFSLDRLTRIAPFVAVGGALQVSLTVGATAGVAMALGLTPPKAVFFGFVVALSSTALVLRALTDRGELDAPHGRFIVGALIFQDLSVVPMMLVIPRLAGGSQGTTVEILMALGQAAAVVVLAVLLARLVVPRAFAWVDRTRSREVFLLAVLGVCIGTAWLTSLVGLSLALGAFLGGMVVAGTAYGSRALGDILPLRDVFMSVFFVSLGLLFDARVVLQHPGTVGLLLAAFILGKGLLASLAALVMRFPARVAFLSGVGLAQFGEFGFVLTGVAVGAGLASPDETRELLAAGIASMFLTPVLVHLAPHVSAGARLLRPLERLLGARGIDECKPEHAALADHVLVVGYGIAGQMLSRTLADLRLPYLVLELNADVVRRASAEGQPIYYGDVTTEEALRHAHAAQARAVVILINDRDAAERAVSTIHDVAPSVPILLRTRYLLTGPALFDRGATDIVFEEVEAGVEMLARLLRSFDVPHNLLHEQLERARESTAVSARPAWDPARTLGRTPELEDLRIDRVLLRERDFAPGRSALDLDLRRASGALAVALKRDGDLVSNPDPERPFQAGDCVYLVGSREQILSASRLLTRGPQ